MDQELRHRIRFRLQALQSENGETLFEQVCAEIARARIHKNIKMSGFVAGRGDKGRDFENVPGRIPELVGDRGEQDGLRPDDSVVGACTLGRSNPSAKICHDVRTIHEEGPKPDHIYHFYEADFPSARQVELCNWCQETYATRLYIITGNTLADWLCDPDLRGIARGLLGVSVPSDSTCPFRSMGDLAWDTSEPVAGSPCLYAVPGPDDETRSRPAFAAQLAPLLRLEDLDPLRACLVRQALQTSDEEAGAAVWKGMSRQQQMALALLETAIFLSKPEYLERLIPEHDWTSLLARLERERLVESRGTGFFHAAEGLRAQMEQATGLLDQAREHWMQVLTEYEGFWDLDMARCLHLFTAGDRGKAIEIAHGTMLSVEDPVALDLYGGFLDQIDTQAVQRSLSPHYRLLLDDAIGVHHVHLGQYPQATRRFQAMLKRARRIEDDWAVVEALLHLGRTAHAAGDEDRAASFYRRSIDEARRRGETVLLGRALYNLSQYLVRTDPAQARALLAESTEIKQQTGDGSPVALWMANGLMAAESGDPAAALKCFRKAEVAVGADGYQAQLAQALHNQANALSELGRLDEAVEKGAEALALARTLNDPELLRLTVQGQAVRLSQQGESRQAMPLFDELAALKGSIGDLSGKAIALSDGAVMRLRVGEMDAAMGRFIEARHVAEAAGGEQEIALVLHNHAWGLRDSGDRDAALRLLSQHYRTATQNGRWHLAAELARELADENRRSRGLIDETDDWYRKAIDAARRARDPERQVFLMGQRFACLRDSGRMDDADAAVRELLDVTRCARALTVQHAAARLEAGNLCAERSDLDQAAEQYRVGLKALEGQSDQQQRALLLGNLGELERRRGNLDEAERCMREGLELIPLDDWEGRFHALHNLALVLATAGQEQDALALLEQIRDRSKARGDWESHAKAWIELGSTAWNQGRQGLAMQRWRRALEVAESNGYPRSAAMAALGLARAHLERGEVDCAADMLNGRTVDPPRDLAADLANTHAEVLLRQGRLDQAASTLQRGLQLAPATADQAGLRSALARIHGAQGRFDAAWTDWEAAFALAENTEARRAIYLDGLDIAVRQDGETLREDGRIEALWRRIREDPERPSVRALSYALAERLWESDPEGASLVHFVTMTEDLTKDSLDSYIADGLHLFRRLLEHPTGGGFGESVQRRVTLHEIDSGTRPPDEKLLWPFRMAERYQSSTEASATPTSDQIAALFEAVWVELAPERASPEETSD